MAQGMRQGIAASFGRADRRKCAGKNVANAGRGLNGAEEELADVVGVVEAERPFDLIDGDTFGHGDDILVEWAGRRSCTGCL